ncbi:putative DNA replication ATP-dependent helicase dna2 [Blumeria hordei DH14]|uniref:DNA replication ATP-dependent helicase/nuclease n=1 Tax=Blumeria graminis f. sp. hordei (strain DH14) TaxID=546991 RepID=N1JI55_BLUG1|nr:putative DNA replication ATP-dependent helicase dna2 [Blumeria hordei DH14]
MKLPFESDKISQQHRSQWNRNKSFSENQAPKAETKPLQEKPPIPISSATKNKLINFQFNGHFDADNKIKTTPEGLGNEEEENVSRDIVERPEEKTTSLALPTNKHDNLSASIPQENLSTPCSKLALPDLIGMGDVRRSVHEVSPDDKIEWDHNKGIGQDNGPRFGAIRTARKRARSSSPVASSPLLASHQFDPGTELWGRFSVNKPELSTQRGPSVPVLAHLMQTSSPKLTHSGMTPRTTIKFRRAQSCGNQFPQRRDSVGGSFNDALKNSAKVCPSKLAVLIERVQEGFTQPKLSYSASKFHTKPDCGLELDNFNPESLPPVEIPCKSFSDTKRLDDGELSKDPIDKTLSPAPRASSDYGDFDDDELDASLIEVFGIEQGIPIHQSPNNLRASINPVPLLTVQQATPTSHSTLPRKDDSSRCCPPISNNEVCDFDDSEDDIFSADLEILVSQYDKRPIDKPPLTITKTSPKLPKLESGLAKNESEDEFADGDLNDADFVAVEATYQTPNSRTALLNQKVGAIQRYLVTKVMDSVYEDSLGRQSNEKILMLSVGCTIDLRVVHLRGIWLDTPVPTEAYVHIIGRFDCTGRCIIDNENNLLILHPDHLISSTVVADSFGCVRRAILQERVKATSEKTAPLVYGTILHEIFQTAMQSNRWDTKWLDNIIQEITIRHLEDLYTIKVHVVQAIKYLKSKMPELQSWAGLFVSPQPKPGAHLKLSNGATALMCISKLLEVEQHVWSPMYGIKGNIDATVQVTIKDGQENRTLTVPFEVKTGKNQSISHRAQTTLYNLLLSDRYDVNIADGILYYMETSETIRIPAVRHDICHMIMQRNRLACHAMERNSKLPSMLKNDNLCNSCYAKIPCLIYHKFVDEAESETCKLKANFSDLLKHLTPRHKEFFLKWDDLLMKEEKEISKFRRELWTMLSSEREKLGRCFSHVIIQSNTFSEDQNYSKINRFQYTMIKAKPTPSFSFLDSQMTVGDPIVISDENGHFALANGFVIRVSRHEITVKVDRRLYNEWTRQPGFDALNNQVFGDKTQDSEQGTHSDGSEALKRSLVYYRLDKDELSNGMATIRNNLIRIMVDEPSGSRHIRDLIVDLKRPQFRNDPTSLLLQDSEFVNVDQKEAIQKVMNAEDYALVLGMPGTGKTTTVAHIIRALVSRGKSVLLTSYTHTAVDNILLKLKHDGIMILRLGQISKVIPEVQGFVTLAASPKHSFEEIQRCWHGTPVVATTCLGINHAVFSERTFDYCIVDEASQITLPVCLGPIRLARTFVLVGDHFQLPPLVRNEEARKGGLDISLFKHLSDMHPSSVVYLEHQYRMCEDVMTLSNCLIYGGRLKCGNRQVSQREIFIPDMKGLNNHHFSPLTSHRSQRCVCPGLASSSCWLHELIKPSTKVSFINTDPLLPLAREVAKGNRIVNPTEAKICNYLVQGLLSVGISASSIGVMTHYRSQLALLKHSLSAHSQVEMHTTDRFQGRDKEVIILSLVRSNEAKSIGELLKDWRRINVAFTRARTKLLVIGSRQTLKGSGPSAHSDEEMVARFVKLMESRDWVFDLPAEALENHVFGEVAASASGSSIGQLDILSQAKRSSDPGEADGPGAAKPKRRALGPSLTRVGGPKRIRGQRPFQIPIVGLLRDIMYEAVPEA